MKAPRRRREQGVAVTATDPTEPASSLLKRFQRVFVRSGLGHDMRAKRWAESRSERRRQKHRRAEQRNRKVVERQRPRDE